MRKNRHNGNLAQRRWLNRHLWPSMYRAIDEIQTTWVVAENVAGIRTFEPLMAKGRRKQGLELEN